jgi:L-lactate dehydrogenase complex protein LldF
VNNDLPRMLSLLRSKLADGDERWNVLAQSRSAKAAFQAWAWIMSSRPVLNVLLGLGRVGQRFMPKPAGWLRKLPGPLGGWTRGRDFPVLARESFSQSWSRKRGGKA